MSSPVLPATARSWSPPQALLPNETYEWEVEALRDGNLLAKAPAPPEPEARFATLPNDGEKRLKNLRESFGSSHLVMGVAYAKAGLLVRRAGRVPSARARKPGERAAEEVARQRDARASAAHPDQNEGRPVKRMPVARVFAQLQAGGAEGFGVSNPAMELSDAARSLTGVLLALSTFH